MRATSTCGVACVQPLSFKQRCLQHADFLGKRANAQACHFVAKKSRPTHLPVHALRIFAAQFSTDF